MRQILTLVLLVGVVGLSGCATIVNGRRQPVTINSTPDGAYVSIDGNQVGKTPWTGEIERASGKQATVTKDGYNASVVVLTTRTSGWFWGNIICGGFLGSTTDACSGGIYEYSPGAYHVALDLKPPAPNTAPNAESVATNEREAKVKRFVLIYFKEIGQEIPAGAGERLTTLKEFMGYAGITDQQFADKIKDDYAKASSADNFAERMVLQIK